VRLGGVPLMLKVADAGDDEAHGALVLQAYGGRGAVTLVEYSGAVSLMERAAGLDLAGMVLAGQDDEATGIICDVVGQLHETDGDWPELIPIPRRTDDLRRHLAEGRVGAADLSLMARVAAVADEMCAESRREWRLLHGDIHHFNILQSARGWLAIDPKGILGPAVYDYANALCNPYMETAIVADPVRMARAAAIMAERAGVERQVLLRWTFVHGAQCAAWSLAAPDQLYWLACAKVAGGLAGVV
jgi:streptomycin 6-kinase